MTTGGVSVRACAAVARINEYVACSRVRGERANTAKHTCVQHWWSNVNLTNIKLKDRFQQEHASIFDWNYMGLTSTLVELYVNL
jgi:hypothetical protein